MLSSSTITIRHSVLILIGAFALTACRQNSQPIATDTPLPVATNTPQPTLQPTPTPHPEISIDIELPEGDPESGFTPAIKYRCYGCHADPDSSTFGPSFESYGDIPAISKRGDLRMADPAYTGKATNNYEYIIESILIPEAFVIVGEWEEPMPTYFSDIIDDQDLADIIAWMASIE
jgi:hypothetical protein